MAAPNLFNVAVDYWLSHSLERCLNLGVSLNGVNKITDLRYADDICIFAELIDTISDALMVLSEEASPLGLSLNFIKTKIQSLSDYLAPLPTTIQNNNVSIETVNEFIYLGSKITSDCTTSCDINRRIGGMASGTFGRLRNIWKNGKITTKSKIRILNTCILPIVTYASETWTLTAAQSRRVDAFHRNCLRSILGIRWFHRVSNDEVYDMVGNPTHLSTIIRRGRLRLLGHIARLPDNVPARQILSGASGPPPNSWRRPRGRPRRTWIAELGEFAPIPELMAAAQDRRRLRQLVATIT